MTDNKSTKFSKVDKSKQNQYQVGPTKVIPIVNKVNYKLQQ